MLPKHISIYRDGVGDSMRQQVLDQELSQFKKILIELYPQNSPSITLIVVNKRIHQQFFEKIGTKTTEFLNPR
jgi:eukaryotic translation initiation factor 2C